MQAMINGIYLLGIKSKLYYRKDKDYYMIRISRKEFVKQMIERFSNNSLYLKRKFEPFFFLDWSRIPGFDNRGKEYEVLLITQSN